MIFGNRISERDYEKAVASKKKYIGKFGDDSDLSYPVRVKENAVIGDILGVKDVLLGRPASGKRPQMRSAGFDEEKGLIVGNIRMGFGHYRISMAIASAAHAMGYQPYWMDLNSFPETTCTKVISAQNDLYSLGSRISQKSRVFNKVVWEPMNYEGFRKLSYNASDQKNAELMAKDNIVVETKELNPEEVDESALEEEDELTPNDEEVQTPVEEKVEEGGNE